MAKSTLPDEMKRKLKKFKSDSTMTEEDAIKLGRELNENLEERRLSKETVEAIKKARARIKAGKFITSDEMKKKLGL